MLLGHTLNCNTTLGLNQNVNRAEGADSCLVLQNIVATHAVLPSLRRTPESMITVPAAVFIERITLRPRVRSAAVSH